MRVPKEKETEYKATIPLSQQKIESSGECFGKEWDMRTNECGVCADNILCGSIFSKEIRKKETAIAENNEGYFLDEADFGRIDEEALMEYVKSVHDMEVGALVEYVKDKAKCSDNDAVIAWILRFIKEKKRIKTRNGIIVING